MDFLDSKENIFLISGFLVTLLLIGLAVGQQNYDEINVNVHIAAATILDVNPNSTYWSALSIGSTSSDAPFIVENIGSQAISTVDVNVTGNTSNPYGASSAAEFDAGNFIIMNSSNQGTGAFLYINKRDWNESRPDYVIAPEGWESEDYYGAFGRFKSASSGGDGLEYFWFTNKTGGAEHTYGAEGNCSNGTIYLANHRHTRSETGDINFSNTGNYTSITLTEHSSGTYGVGDLDSHPSSDLSSYCIRVWDNCTMAEFFYWNNAIDAAAGGTCDNELYAFSGTLNPGSTFTIYLQARIPYGVAAGQTTPGTVSLIAA